jgi:peptidoglycan/xylan/chitin deacetylase (PgdA/CDA1 family)
MPETALYRQAVRFLALTKRLFTMGLSCGLFIWDQTRRLFLRLVGATVAGRCVVLLYHAIPVGQRVSFARQMDAVRRIAIPLRGDSQAALAPSLSYVAVTFDDGLASFAENALPELEKRLIPAVLFVVTGKLGTVPMWTSYSKEAMPTERMLTAEELRELSGKVLIGSHSVMHRMLTTLDNIEAKQEIDGSRQQLQAMLGQDVELFSFPYGAFSEDLLAYCKEAGYKRVFTTLPVLSFSDPQEFVSGRIGVKPTDWALEFRLKISGSYRWLPYAFAAKKALLKSMKG